MLQSHNRVLACSDAIILVAFAVLINGCNPTIGCWPVLTIQEATRTGKSGRLQSHNRVLACSDLGEELMPIVSGFLLQSHNRVLACSDRSEIAGLQADIAGCNPTIGCWPVLTMLGETNPGPQTVAIPQSGAGLF